jgi:hypothetical protein
MGPVGMGNCRRLVDRVALGTSVAGDPGLDQQIGIIWIELVAWEDDRAELQAVLGGNRDGAAEVRFERGARRSRL